MHQLGSLLFGLGLFLSRRGASGLWLQLLAKPGHIDPTYMRYENVVVY